MPRPKAFLSYRSVDRERVRSVAEQLMAKGIDAWWDVWEIPPGDNFVAKINDGLEQCECGIAFLSNDSLAGAWQQDEITILKTYAVDDKRPLIPVLLDVAVKVPAILRPYARLTADQIDSLVDAIVHRGSAKPTLGPESLAASCARFSIRLTDLPNSAIGVSARLDEQALVSEITVSPGADFAFSYADFLHSKPIAPRFDHPAAAASVRELDLIKLGNAIGKVVFCGDIGTQLASRLTSGATQELELVFEAASPRLLSIPFESARLPNGRTPALLPGVFIWRRALISEELISPQPPPPGPLKILVAVGAPDEGKTPNTVLNSERELQTILNAVEKARALNNAYVRVLEVGSPDQIGSALRERSYHVLHLSGHGTTGVIELEDEDGNPVQTDASALAQRIRESGHAAPLIVLASCKGGLGSDQCASFAQALLDSGVPAVLAMQTAVSDSYCTDLAGKFYEELSLRESPLPSRALALARRTLEEARQKSAEKPAPEYATPSLFLRGQEQPVLHRAGSQAPLPEPTRNLSSGAIPMLDIGELIGRRKEARQIIRVLTDDPKSVDVIGRKTGCEILGVVWGRAP